MSYEQRSDGKSYGEPAGKSARSWEGWLRSPQMTVTGMMEVYSFEDRIFKPGHSRTVKLKP